ncbi:MAG TPA: hypothetical protein VF669_19220 [Tepidisphaeraceae bacterium]|jgi:hypothetical protein
MTNVVDVVQSKRASDAPARTHRSWSILILLLGLAIAATVIALKFSALHSWRYTSDLFVIDTMFQETLRGDFMMEYTYGCQFGDHACLIFLLGIPIKYLLRQNMVYALLLVSPVTLIGCGPILYFAIRSIAGAAWALLGALLYFLSLGVIRGPFEVVFGFHIDTISGYIATAIAVLLLERHEVKRTRSLTLLTLALIIIFITLKEEMALLGIFFFIMLLIWKRDWLHWTGLALSIVAFGVEMGLTHYLRTPWNRTNERLVGHLITSFRRDGIHFLFSHEKTGYWIAIFTLIAAMSTLIIICKRISIIAAALFAIGLAKLAFGWAVNDFDLFAWHNYPAVCMLTGGIILQSLELRRLPPPNLRLIKPAVAALLVLSIGWFIVGEARYAVVQARLNRMEKKKNLPFMPAIADVQKHIPEKSKVVAIPRYSVASWTAGWRYSFFPHGITQSPMGIADYIVVTRNKERYAVPELRVFSQIYQNGKYKLFLRKKFLPGELESREKFAKRFGEDSIGPNPTPAQRNRKKKAKQKHPAVTTRSAPAS